MNLVMTRATAMGLSLLVAGCASPPPPQVGAWIAAGGIQPPPQGACPGVAHLDLTKVAEQRAERVAQSADPNATGFVELPASAEARVPADAVVVIRANLPAGGMYSSDVRAVVWKAADGTWSLWRQSRDYGAPPPPPPPPPHPDWAEDSPAYRAAMEERALHERTQNDPDLRWPPQMGRLPDRTVRTIEAALADPCRAWDPDYFPYAQPLLRREEGRDGRLCPPDGSYYAADITEPGRARRGIGASCINDTPTFQIISAVAYAEPEPEG